VQICVFVAVILCRRSRAKVKKLPDTREQVRLRPITQPSFENVESLFAASKTEDRNPRNSSKPPPPLLFLRETPETKISDSPRTPLDAYTDLGEHRRYSDVSAIQSARETAAHPPPPSYYADLGDHKRQSELGKQLQSERRPTLRSDTASANTERLFKTRRLDGRQFDTDMADA
jgi:hypothetical protein